MLFWLAVTPISRALIAHSTAGQCNVVNRAPIPSVLCPRLPPHEGKRVDSGSCLWTRLLRRSRFSHVAGKKTAFLLTTPPPRTALAALAPAAGSSFHAQSPLP